MAAAQGAPAKTPNDGTSEEQLYVVSWNVAALPTTIATLLTVYPDRPFWEYLERWDAPIFALQESKVTRLRRETEPINCGVVWKGNTVGGWESFWSDAAARGMNGVVTFAKAGLVHSADARPFRDKALDDDGRCVVTRFSAFVLFNVYVPNSRGGIRAAYRSEFVRALQRAMAREAAETGLPVMLCGDLNMTYRPQDCHWTHRRLNVLAAAHNVPSTSYSRPWRGGTAARREMIEQVMKWGHLPPADLTTFAPVDDGAPDELYGASVRARLRLLQKEDAENQGWCPAPDPTQTNGETSEDLPLTSVYVEAQLPKPREPAHPANACWFDLVAAFGHTAHSSEANALMNGFLQGLDMVDSLLAVRPEALCRYTCHNQMVNARYPNVGSRIDYFLVPRALAGRIRAGPGPLPSGTMSGDEPMPGCVEYCDIHGDTDLRSEFTGAATRAGVCAATANGKYQPAPMTGGGLPELSRPLCELQFATPRQTGIVYTAPQLSDHLAITLLLDGVTLAKRSGGTAASLTEPTRDCMFRLKQPSIMAMFAKRTASSSSSLAAATNGSADGLKAARSESNGVAAAAATAKTTRPSVDVVEVSESD